MPRRRLRVFTLACLTAAVGQPSPAQPLRYGDGAPSPEACEALGLKGDEIVAAMVSFPGLAHRMEQVGRIGKVLFVNDSKATNADSTEKALAAFSDIYWIAGAGAVLILAICVCSCCCCSDSFTTSKHDRCCLSSDSMDDDGLTYKKAPMDAGKPL